MKKSAHNPCFTAGVPIRQDGFTLIEMMVAITISLFVIAALAAIFVTSSRARNELAAANEQIENGRYALVTLKDDLELAGYLSRFNTTGAVDGSEDGLNILMVPAAKPDPCDTALGSYYDPVAPTRATNLRAAVVMHVQGYNNGGVTGANTCGTLFADRKDNTDILVIRRVSTCTKDTADCGEADGYVDGAPYFQASTCSPLTGGAELSNANPSEWFRLDTTIGNLNRRPRTCTGLAPMRQFITHIYFIAKNSQAGDDIPTLKRVDLGAGGAFASAIPIASGIENLHFEYGIDIDNDGAPDVYTADPDTFDRPGTGVPALKEDGLDCPAEPADCVVNWRDVMAVKIYLLARNTEPSPGHNDTKVYATGAATTVGPFNDPFKRHAYQAVVRLTNPAGRRE